MTIKEGLIESLGSPLTSESIKLMILGSGELGKEIVIEAQRLGIETVAVDRYPNAPAQQVAHRAYTGDMMDADFLRRVIREEKPDVIAPEIEAINLDVLFEFEEEGFRVIPNAKATWTAMHRERIRELIAKKAGVKTSKYEYADTDDEAGFKDACERIGYPCISKAIMSSSGHGSYLIKGPEDIPKAIEVAKSEARGSGKRCIIEEYIDFNTEVTELAVRHRNEDGKIITSFPKPCGHVQIGGDYHSSWQGPCCAEYLPWPPEENRRDEKLAKEAERKIYNAAEKITAALGGLGIFGCELFVKERDGKVDIYGNECSPRPHDTGMVTFITHVPSFSEAGLHVRAICGLPIPTTIEDGFSLIKPIAPGASHVILAPSEGESPVFRNISSAMMVPRTTLRLFGKPRAHPKRRMGIALSLADSVKEAKETAERIAHTVEMRTKQHREWKRQFTHPKHLIYRGE